MILAIIQSIPTHPRHVVRTDSFAKFQHLCGMVEQTSYLAAHAACNASMNQIDRVLTADADIRDCASILAAATRLFDAGPFDALVIPGVLDAGLQKALCDECAGRLGDFSFRLILDVERRASIDDIASRQTALPRFASLAFPWSSTLTPGRRSEEPIPASCIVAPLALGCCEYLRGLHELDALQPGDADYLLENGVEVMTTKTVNRRRVVARLQPVRSKAAPAVQPRLNQFEEVGGMPPSDDPIQARIDRDEAAIEQKLMDQIDAKCDEVLRTKPFNNPALWSTLTRCATSVLREAKARGEITNFHVRCDEETASWGTASTPVVEVLISFATRVKQVRISTGKLS